MLLLGLGRIGGGILEIYTYLSLSVFLFLIVFEAVNFFLLNWNKMHCWNILSFLLTFRLSHPDL